MPPEPADSGGSSGQSGVGCHAVVVGGSLVGLCAALALSRMGWRVTVLERSTTNADGMGISIDRHKLAAITGADTSRLPVIETGFPATGWGPLHSFLQGEARSRPNVILHRGHPVLRVQDDNGNGAATVHTDNGVIYGDVVIGADGEGSTVRRMVAPDRADSSFSGVTLWRGMVPETSLRDGFRDQDLNFHFRPAALGMLATYGIPGTGPDPRFNRQGVFIWFDSTRRRMLEALGLLQGHRVAGTLISPAVPEDVVEELRNATTAWSPPWREGVRAAIRRRAFIGTPLTEYFPTRLVRGRVALIGNAAHAVGPVTGSGFPNGVLDVEALTNALQTTGKADLARALGQYEQNRLPLAQTLVQKSQRWSATFRHP